MFIVQFDQVPQKREHGGLLECTQGFVDHGTIALIDIGNVGNDGDQVVNDGRGNGGFPVFLCGHETSDTGAGNELLLLAGRGGGKDGRQTLVTVVGKGRGLRLSCSCSC